MNLYALFGLMLAFLGLTAPYVEAITKEDVKILTCPSNRKDKRKGKLAICAIFKDDGSYLREWIEYHRVVGVSHFYLYNNCSDDTYWEVLKPYVDQGVVEIFDVPFDSSIYRDGAQTHNFVQKTCYNHAIDLVCDYNKWLAIIDTDEFICPVVDGTVTKALDRYSYADGLAVYWQVYGTSNVWDIGPRELLIEKLLYKEPNDTGSGLFKSIVRPKYATCHDPHWTKVSGSMVIPNHHLFSHNPSLSTLPVDIIRINHYTFRTLSFYELIKKPRRALWGFAPPPEMERQILDRANSTYDPAMMQFVPALKKRMFGKHSLELFVDLVDSDACHAAEVDRAGSLVARGAFDMLILEKAVEDDKVTQSFEP
jgi:hypothetical protein